MATPNRQYPEKDLSLEELASQVRRAATYVAESEERHTFMVKSLASLYDELKVARRTLAQAERNLLVASKVTPKAVLTGTAVNTALKVS